MLNTPTSTLKSGLLTGILLCAQVVCATVGNPPASPPMSIPVILPESALIVTPYYTPVDPDSLPVIYDDCRLNRFDDLPEEYDNWDEASINPYGIRLVDMTDTVKIDMRGYFPPSQKYVTSNFGFRRGQFHYGIDLKVHKGDSVFCAFDGQVRLTKYQRGGYGQYVVVRHQNGLETLYAHLDKTFVTPGQAISAGEALGLGGNTGRSTGYHLHFETRYLGNVIDPNDLYDFTEYSVKNDILWLSAANFEYVKEVEKVRFWTVKQGDTLGRISSRTGVSIARLCSLNNIKKTSILRIGQKIRYS